MYEITEQNLPQLLQEHPFLVVDLGAEWCGPCKALSPILDRVAHNHPDIGMGKVNVDEHPAISLQYGIRSIPTLLFFRNGELVLKHVGMINEPQLTEKITTLYHG